MIQAYIFDFKPFYAYSMELCFAWLQANTGRNRRVQSYSIHHTPEQNCQKKDARMNNFPSVQIFDLFYVGVTSFFGRKISAQKFALKTRSKNAPILELFSEKFLRNSSIFPKCLNDLCWIRSCVMCIKCLCVPVLMSKIKCDQVTRTTTADHIRCRSFTE